MDASPLHTAVAAVPPGRWAIGVSGGADSVALLRLLHNRTDLTLHITHLDHETRQGESAADAQFVENLARQLNLPISIRRRSEIEKTTPAFPKNIPARFRAARMIFFNEIVTAHNLSGIILAHHADDQAETILHRLIRGSGPTSLAGMSARTIVAGLRIVRPLLNIRSNQLRDYLSDIQQNWREDSSNRSPQYRRNQLRVILKNNPELHEPLIHLGAACAALRKWITSNAPTLPEQFTIDQLASLAPPLGRRAAARWLIERGSPPGKITPAVCDQLINMARDMASSPRQHFPGRLPVRRKKGTLFTDAPVSS